MTIDERIAAELRRHAPQVDEHVAWDRLQSKTPVRGRARAIRLVPMSAAALGFLVLGFLLVRTLSSGPEPASDPPSPFLGTWVTVDADGSTPTMTIGSVGDGAVEITVLDDLASVCSGAASTMTGTGRLESDWELVIASPVFTCDDGSVPQALSGPPLEEQLRDLTFVHDPMSDTLTDNLGSVWSREGNGPAALGWWPQANLDEVRLAQDRADAGDPDYTWQLDPELDGDEAPWGAEIFARFIEEELGWEKFTGGWDGSGWLSMGVGGGVYEGVTFIRCAPGQTNPLNSLYADAPPEIRGCAPTIDEFTYETVGIDVSQPGRRGLGGIWVVDHWEMYHPKSAEPGSLFGLVSPEYDQVLQIIPPSGAEVTAFLEAFLQARVSREGAEPYVLREPEESPFRDHEVPLLYATTSGDPYERFEIEKVQGPVWPTGLTEYRVRLFAEGGTVVEQLFHVVRRAGELGLVYGYSDDAIPTTENGRSVPVPYSILEGEVTFAAAPPWGTSVFYEPSDTLVKLNGSRDDHVVIATDPLPALADCDSSGPTDAEALAEKIRADPNSEATATVPVRIAGLEGLQLDVDVDVSAVVSAFEHGSCRWIWGPELSDQWRMRLYLLDYPGGSAPVLAIAVIAAPETDFERVLEEATPIIESLELHAR